MRFGGWAARELGFDLAERLITDRLVRSTTMTVLGGSRKAGGALVMCGKSGILRTIKARHTFSMLMQNSSIGFE